MDAERTISIVASCIVMLASTCASGAVSVDVDVSEERQVIEGFGASCDNRGDSGVDQIGAMRPQVIEAVHGQVGLTMGDIHCSPYEGSVVDGSQAVSWANLDRSNDNADPDVFDWTRFHWWRSDPAKTLLYDLALTHGFDSILLSGHVSTRWADQWLNDIRSLDRDLYLREAAENAVAILVHWRDQYGIVPEWHQPFNEPLSGNNEVYGGDTQEVIDLVKAVGGRCRAEGFDAIKFVVASEETTAKSLETASAILQDADARQYVGAIGYHCYPYGSTYAKAANIIATSGSGVPSQTEIDQRTALRDLAAQHGLQIWMTEVSHSEAGTWDTCRARAIHIRDELLYAGANAYWGMYNMYDTSQASEEDHIVIFDPSAQTHRITGMGRAIGHYARWLTPKQSYCVGSSSNDSLVQVSAFRDYAANRFVAVVINNSLDARGIEVAVSGATLGGEIVGEQSTESGGYWSAITPFAATPGGFTSSVPGLSITTFACVLSDFGPPSAPEIGVWGNGVSIIDGDAVPGNSDDTDFGGVELGMSPAAHEFTIANTGDAPLYLTGSPRVTVSGAGAVDFSVIQGPLATVAPGASTSFVVQFDPTTVGVKSATLAIDNSDADEGAYEFAVQGTCLLPSAPTHAILATAGIGGTITPSGAVEVPEGDNQIFLVYADGWYEIEDVVVDGVSVGSVSAHQFVSVSEDHAIAVSFAVIDEDGDGMPDGWELENGLDPTIDDSTLDLDGDGNTNLQEWLAGTSPAAADESTPPGFSCVASSKNSVATLCMAILAALLCASSRMRALAGSLAQTGRNS